MFKKAVKFMCFVEVVYMGGIYLASKKVFVTLYIAVFGKCLPYWCWNNLGENSIPLEQSVVNKNYL